MTILKELGFPRYADGTAITQVDPELTIIPAGRDGALSVQGGTLNGFIAEHDAVMAIQRLSAQYRRDRMGMQIGGTRILAAVPDGSRFLMLTRFEGNLLFQERLLDGTSYSGGFFGSPDQETNDAAVVAVEVRYTPEGVIPYVENSRRDQIITVPGNGEPSYIGSTIPIPAGMDTRYVGIATRPYGSPSGGILYWTSRDEVDVVSVDTVTQRRASPELSKYTAQGFTNVVGANAVASQMYNAAGDQIGVQTTGIVENGLFDITSAPVPKAYEGQQVLMRVVVTGTHSAGHDSYYFTAGLTVTAGPIRLGQNASFEDYYERSNAWRDLANVMRWNIADGSFVRNAREPLDLIYEGLWVPAEDVGLTERGVPTHFSTKIPNGVMNSIMPFYWGDDQVGDYLMDWSEQPGLRPVLVKPGSDVRCTLKLDHYGVGKHLINLAKQNHANHLGPGDFDIFVIQIRPESGPEGPYSTFSGATDWNFTIKKVNDPHPERLVSDGHIRWWRQLNCQIMRCMTWQGANEQYGRMRPPRSLNSEDRMYADGAWPQRQVRPIEQMAQIAHFAGKALWRNLPRSISREYIDHEIDWLLANYPKLHVIYEPSNEPWNFGFAQFGAFAEEGYRRGLGLPDAQFGVSTGEHEIAQNWEKDRQYFAGDLVTTGNGIYQGLRVTEGREPTPDDPSTTIETDPVLGRQPETQDQTHWLKIQNAQLAQTRALSELTHLVADALIEKTGSRYGSQYQVYIGTWQISPNYVQTALEWGDLGSKIYGVATATYFGASVMAPDESQSPILFEMPPGPARQARMLAEVAIDAARVLRQWQATYRYLHGLNVAKGWNLKLSSYEGGHHFSAFAPDVSNGLYDKRFWEGRHAGDPADDADDVYYRSQVDIQAMLDSPAFRKLWGDTITAIAEYAGGDIVWFDAFGGRVGIHNHGRLLYFFGTSDSVTDYSARYMGINDAAVRLELPPLDLPEMELWERSPFRRNPVMKVQRRWVPPAS